MRMLFVFLIGMTLNRAVAASPGVQPSVVAAPAAAEPIRVFVLAGQSNMEGQSVADLDGPDYNEGRGTLRWLWRDPAFRQEFAFLRTPGDGWAVRDNVRVRHQLENGPLKSGPLALGFTRYDGRHHFGPELGFGHVVGENCAAPVLLIKTAWGGKSLYRDFRPPNSGGTVGPYYTRMLAEIRAGLTAAAPEFPNHAGRVELAGFVWYQGWNDGCEPSTAVPEYETNLVNLIRDVRRELDVSELPVVVGELTGPWVEAPGEWAALRRAQAAAARRPEFAGTVAFVSTHEFVRRPEDSPNPGHGHHEFGNAETGLRVGIALGRAMVELLERGKPSLPSKATKPTGHVPRTVEGWMVRVDDRLLAPPHDETGRRALRFLEGRLFDIRAVVPAGPLERLQRVVIVLDLSHGDLTAMQYHPSADWLAEHGYDTNLARCVHIPVAADLPTPRNIREQPWVVLHELAHAYHDQVLGFDDHRIREAYEAFRRSGHGDQALLHDGTRTRHYGLTDPKEFFAEMTEAFFGSNDFQPFNRAELRTAEPAICDLLDSVWREPPSVRTR